MGQRKPGFGSEPVQRVLYAANTLSGEMATKLDFNRFLRLYKAGRLDLDGMISRRIRLDEVNDAMGSLGDADVIRQVIDF
jgi:S-(hydroxymethyl)glutathione dehydrogenase/alcohol dehydrogenase